MEPDFGAKLGDASIRLVCDIQRKAKVADETQHTMNWLVYADNMIMGNGRASTLLIIVVRLVPRCWKRH